MHDISMARRGLVLGAAAATMAAGTAAAAAQNRTDTAPRVLDGKPVPEPEPERSAGPVRPGRGSDLKGEVAVVTGAARGIGRAIAVELAANGDVRSPTVPMKVGWLQPDDISPVAVFLASDAANLVTGAEYEVTAGDSAKDI